MTSEEIPACFQHLIHQPVAQPTTHPTAARSWFWAQPGDREALSQRLCSAPGCRSARWSATPQHPRLSAAGAQLAVGELTDGGALAAAMQAAGAVFAVTTPFEAGLDAELLQGHAIIGAATAARVPQLVFSSVAEALAGTGIPQFESKAAIDRALAAGDVPHTVVAPTYFYGNALGGYQDLQNGVLELPLPADRALQQLDRPDLGAFVELALRDPQAFTGHWIELASDAPTPTPTQMSAAMSGALGRPVRFTEVPMSSVRRGSPDMAAMWEFLRSVGYQADIAALHRDYPAVACPDVPDR